MPRIPLAFFIAAATYGLFLLIVDLPVRCRHIPRLPYPAAGTDFPPDRLLPRRGAGWRSHDSAAARFAAVFLALWLAMNSLSSGISAARYARGDGLGITPSVDAAAAEWYDLVAGLGAGVVVHTNEPERVRHLAGRRAAFLPTARVERGSDAATTRSTPGRWPTSPATCATAGRSSCSSARRALAGSSP